MVIFRSPDGKPGYHQAETLEEAVGFVERLRNHDGVTDARVFRMDEVAIEFKVYYRVEVAGPGAGEPSAVAPETPSSGTTERTDADADDTRSDGAGVGGDEVAATNGAGSPGRFGKFSRA